MGFFRDVTEVWSWAYADAEDWRDDETPPVDEAALELPSERRYDSAAGGGFWDLEGCDGIRVCDIADEVREGGNDGGTVMEVTEG